MIPVTLSDETPEAYLATQAQAPSIGKRACAAWASLAYRYKRTMAMPGWAHLASTPRSAGFEGHALYHEASESTVFVNVGSNSALDFWEGGGAAFGDFKGPLEDSLDFLIRTYSRLAPDDTKNLVCIGHSWGGAIAEAQVSLALTALEDAGVTPPPAVFGVGTASAGFERAIRNLAQSRGLAIDEDADWNMRHYIRLGDPIRGQPSHDVIGDEIAPPTIFSPIRMAPRRGSVPDWAISNVVLTNHDSLLYFRMLEMNPKTHLYRARGGKFYQIDGSWPEKLRFGSVHPDAALGCET